MLTGGTWVTSLGALASVAILHSMAAGQTPGKTKRSINYVVVHNLQMTEQKPMVIASRFTSHLMPVWHPSGSGAYEPLHPKAPDQIAQRMLPTCDAVI
jgi:hypothetical protein